MSHARLNQSLFESVSIFEITQSLTGQPMEIWELDARLESAGLSFKVRDSISVTTFENVCRMVDAAFLAGYLIGRNPDLLLLDKEG